MNMMPGNPFKLQCPYCKDKRVGARYRDGNGAIRHVDQFNFKVMCYDQSRATDAEIKEEIRNKVYEDRMGGRDEDHYEEDSYETDAA